MVLRFSALGDVAMMVPVLLAVTKKYPEVYITIVSRGFHRPFFKRINQVGFYEAKLSKEHKGFFGLYRLYRELKDLNINAVVDLHHVLRSNILKFFFRLGGNKVVQIDKGRAEKKALVRTIHKVFKQLKTTHQRYAEAFAALGYEVALTENDLLQSIPLSENVLLFTGNKTEKWVGIAPFAAHSSKMYPLDKMKYVIEKLSNTDTYKIFLFGAGATEQEQLSVLAFNFNNVVSVAGELSFEEELQVISNLDVMLSMDSANAHLATNYGVPVVTLWGVTHPYAGFYPFAQSIANALLSDREKYPAIPTSVYGNKVPKGYEKVMETISESAVVQKIEKLLHTTQ